MAGLPLLIYPAGSSPVTTHSGPRSLLAFWMGGASAPQTVQKGSVRSLHAFWIGGAASAASAQPRGGAGKPRKYPVRRLYEHRPDYDAVAEAYREAERRAKELGEKKRRQALSAVALVEKVLAEVREANADIDLAPLEAALEATANAKAVLAVVERAKRAAEIAESIRQEMQDEEDAVILLLLN